MHLIKRLSFLWVLLALAACQSSKSDGLDELKAQYDFAVPDVSQITKVIISDKQPSTVVLERIGGRWVVGEQHWPVRTDAIEVLLETLSKVTLKHFVQQGAIATVNQRMDVYGKWVEVYAGDQLIKNYIVGSETPNMLGTYYKMVGSELPFAVYIQGFNGYLTTRFFTEENLWRDRTIFGLAPDDIEALELISPLNPSQGWMIFRQDPSVDPEAEVEIDAPNWSLVGAEFESLPVSNPLELMTVVGSIETLKYEGAIVPSDNIWEKKDSIFNSQPAFELHVHERNGETLKVRAFWKRPDREQLDAEGIPHQWDPDRFYAELPDGRMVLIQRYGWRNLLKSRWDFVDQQ
jgi:hypothetical protein